MTLRIEYVPRPAPGAEWQIAVPGQYVWDVISVHATYSASDASSTAPMLDSSGNGNDGIYVGPDLAAGLLAPGLIPGNDAVLTGIKTPLTRYVYAYVGNVGAGGGPFDFEGAFTFELWVKYDPADDPSGVLCMAETPGAVERMYLQIGANGPRSIGLFWGVPIGVYATAVDVFPFDGLAHHVVGVNDSGTGHIYLDGVEIPSAPIGAPPGPSDPAFSNWQLPQGDGPGPGGTWVQDEAACYDNFLDAGEVAAHYAARGDIATYSAAVLDDSPTGYYHLDDPPVHTPASRYTALQVTDGTNILGEYTSGLLSSAPTIFTWLVGVTGIYSTFDDALITIGIPTLALSAGYTLGSVTSQLGADDQWSDIIVWWDDDLMGPGAWTPWNDYSNVLLLP